MEELLERRVLPLLTIWIWTRRTVRELIQQGPDLFIYGWAVLFGISLMVTQALFFEWGDILTTSSLLVAIFGFAIEKRH